MLPIAPYSEIFKEIKRKPWQSTLHAFFRKGEDLNQGLHQRKSLDHATFKKINAVALQLCEQTLWSGLWTYWS